jgi:hypothetical protein
MSTEHITVAIRWPPVGLELGLTPTRLMFPLLNGAA